jgi:hypothetical protein
MLDIMARGEKEDPPVEAVAKPHEPYEVCRRVGKA